MARGVVCYLLDSTNGDSLFWWALMADRPWGSREAETEDDSVRSPGSSRIKVLWPGGSKRATQSGLWTGVAFFDLSWRMGACAGYSDGSNFPFA